jgi:undecaprenyl-diphosphatase
MAVFEIIILALIQGITEFLPISSSGHLLLPNMLLGWQDQGLAFDVAVHIGSLLAVMLYLREDITRLIASWCQHGLSRTQTPDSRLAWGVILATLPAVVVGFLLKDWIALNARTGLVIGMATLGFGVLLGIADAWANRRPVKTQVTLSNAWTIGLFQVLALIPGTSRSGITITGGRFLGLTRHVAARFSFLLSIPIILGAGTLATVDLLRSPTAIDITALCIGAVASFVSAYACIKVFMHVIEKISMQYFVYYRILLGTILIVISLQ